MVKSLSRRRRMVQRKRPSRPASRSASSV
jgi:hypothetical protein